MRHGRPYDSGRLTLTEGAKHKDPYATYGALAVGWRREHAQRVWSAMQAVLALAPHQPDAWTDWAAWGWNGGLDQGLAMERAQRVWQAIQAVIAVVGATAIGMNLENDRGSQSVHEAYARAAGYDPKQSPSTGDL